MMQCKLRPRWTGPRGARYGAPVEQIMTAAGPARVALEQPPGGPPGVLVALYPGVDGPPDPAHVVAGAAAPGQRRAGAGSGGPPG